MSEIQEVPSVDRDTCETTQREEWVVLEVGLPAFLVVNTFGLKCNIKSIFPDFLLNGRNTGEGRIELEIPVELAEEPPQKVTIMLMDGHPQQHSYADGNIQSPLSLTTLPPISLTLTLPLDYPLHRPPIISGLYSSYGWLPSEKLKLLEGTLLDLWEAEREHNGGEGRGILYDWVEVVRSAESCLGKLGMVTDGGIL